MKRSKSLSDIHQDQIEAMSPGSGASTHASDLATMRRARSHENMDDMERESSPQPLAGARSQMLSEKELRDHFNMPLNEVARKFGMCTTALKKLCRKYGVMQWPHRKLRSLEKKIASLRAEQRYTSDGGVHHHIDDEIRKLQQQREMLLNGDGQLHDGDWGGMGDDGDFDDGGGGLSRNNSHNSLSSLSSAQPAPGGGTRGGAGSRETMNELVMTLEEENQSLRALTRSLMNERHDLLNTLDSTAGQSKLLSAGVKPAGPPMGTMNLAEPGGDTHDDSLQHAPSTQQQQQQHQGHPPSQQPHVHHFSQQQYSSDRHQAPPRNEPQRGQEFSQYTQGAGSFKFEGRGEALQQSSGQAHQSHSQSLNSQPSAAMASPARMHAARFEQGAPSTSAGFSGFGHSQHSPALVAFGQAQNSPGFGSLAGFGMPSPMLHSNDGKQSGPPSRPPQMRYRTPATADDREQQEDGNSLAWMAPDFDLDELL